jgi:hypothetical protein
MTGGQSLPGAPQLRRRQLDHVPGRAHRTGQQPTEALLLEVVAGSEPAFEPVLPGANELENDHVDFNRGSPDCTVTADAAWSDALQS